MDHQNDRSAYVIAYAAVSFSGFLVGVLTGWLIWDDLALYAAKA